MERLNFLPLKGKLNHLKRKERKYKLLAVVFISLNLILVFKTASDFKNYKTIRTKIENKYQDNKMNENDSKQKETVKQYKIMSCYSIYIKKFINLRVLNADISEKEIAADILVNTKEEYLNIVSSLEEDTGIRIKSLSGLNPQDQFLKFKVVIEVLL